MTYDYIKQTFIAPVDVLWGLYVLYNFDENFAIARANEDYTVRIFCFQKFCIIALRFPGNHICYLCDNAEIIQIQCDFVRLPRIKSDLYKIKESRMMS